MRSNNLKGHMKVHIIYTSPEVQVENSEEICKDIVNDIKTCIANCLLQLLCAAPLNFYTYARNHIFFLELESTLSFIK